MGKFYFSLLNQSFIHFFLFKIFLFGGGGDAFMHLFFVFSFHNNYKMNFLVSKVSAINLKMLFFYAIIQLLLIKGAQK